MKDGVEITIKTVGDAQTKTAPFKALCQSTEPWGSLSICKGYSMARYGCLITSLAMLSNKTPTAVLKLLQAYDGLFNGRLVIHSIASNVLGLKFSGSSKSGVKPKYPTIMETDNFKALGFGQHFVVWLGSADLIIDPLDGKIKTNPYQITGWRLYRV